MVGITDNEYMLGMSMIQNFRDYVAQRDWEDEQDFREFVKVLDEVSKDIEAERAAHIKAGEGLRGMAQGRQPGHRQEEQ